MNLQDQHVLILGLGVSGLAMARWCARCGANVTVADTRAAPPQLAALQRDVPAARFVSGAFEAALVDATALRAVFKSPGLTPTETAAVTAAAQSSGLWVAGELGLFSQALGELQASRGYQPHVLAVTGTNGKTTVTALTGQLVSRAGKTVAVAGNIGPTLLDTLAAHLAADTLPEVWVIELSSFQLDGEKTFEASAATVLNITQDHLDWHGSMAAYEAAKVNIFGQHALMVLNREDPRVMAMLSAAGPPQGAKAPPGGSAAHAVASVGASSTAGPPQGAKVPPGGRAAHAVASVGAKSSESVRVKLQRPLVRPHVTFGADMPQRPGDFGLEQVNGMVWLVRALDADETRRKRNEVEEELHIQRLMPADALRIRGRHNAVNALAALALASTAGCALGPVLYGLREYRGEPHRVESIGIFNEVEFFDDSKGTNVGATVAALSGLGSERKVVAILGGEGKGQDFSPLLEPVSRYARAVVLIGQDAPQIRAALEAADVPLLEAESMAQAVALANGKAHAGDAVLMSPACASFDMFDNYEHRARVFCAAVGDIARAAGGQLEGAP